MRVQQTRAISEDILRALLRLLPVGVSYLPHAVRRLHAAQLAAGAQHERRLRAS